MSQGLIMQPRMASNSLSSYLLLPNGRITGIHHPTQLKQKVS
jgi:CDP-diacylglycerol pyrophosphatase